MNLSLVILSSYMLLFSEIIAGAGTIGNATAAFENGYSSYIKKQRTQGTDFSMLNKRQNKWGFTPHLFYS